MTTTITPLTLLSSSLIGGLYLACIKFLFLDFPGQFFKLLNALRLQLNTTTTRLVRDKEQLALVSRVENNIFERSRFVMMLIEGQTEGLITDNTMSGDASKTSVDHMSLLYEEAGRLLGMGELGLTSYDVCKTALLASISHQRELFERLVDKTSTITPDELRNHYWKSSLFSSQVNEAIGHLGLSLGIVGVRAYQDYRRHTV